MTTVHDPPARRHAQIAIIRSCASPNRTSANAATTDPAATRRSGPSSSFSHLITSDPPHGADPDRAEKNAVNLRPPRYLMARQERQERQIGAGEGKEREHAHQCRAQILIVRGVANTRANRA